MSGIFLRWERRARIAMGGIALAAAALGLMFKAGWISKTPDWKQEGWYSVSEHAGFLITTEHADEAGCRAAAQSVSVTCESGRALTQKSTAG